MTPLTTSHAAGPSEPEVRDLTLGEALAEVAVVGLLDAKYGEVVAAFVRPAVGTAIDEAQLFAYVACSQFSRARVRSFEKAALLALPSRVFGAHVTQPPACSLQSPVPGPKWKAGRSGIRDLE